MKKLVFAVAGYNLAETGRMVEIAKAAQKHFTIIFASYGGQFEELIEAEDFRLVKMVPRLSKEKLARLRIVLSGETLNTVGYLSKNDLKVRVPREIAFFKEINPVAVLTGWCLSTAISTRAAGIPFINVLHSTSVREYYEAGLQSWPDRTNFALVRWLFGKDEVKMSRFMSSLVLKLPAAVNAYNAIGSKYNLPKFKNFIDLIEGDHTLLADIPEWVGFPKIRPSLHYVGPLPTRIDKPIPEKVASMPRDWPIVYFSMGSSGKPALVADILQGFRDRPYRVIAPVKAHIIKMAVDIPENVIVTGFLPAHKVNSMADISVIHGGQNTVMNACLSGTPIVGIGMHPEQQANLDACVRKGFAIRLSKKKVTAPDVLGAIDKLIDDKNAKKAVDAFSLKLKKWNGPVNAANFLEEHYG
jgi:UDP:flavonoid glycosyltransferase YjiC (YdhE family)